MARSAILAIKIIADAASARRELDETSSKFDRFEAGLDRATGPALAAVGAIGALGTAAYNSASELQQTTGAVESVFGEYAAQVQSFAADAASNVGLAESQYGSLASVLGAQLKNMGSPMEEVAGQTNDLVGLGADLAATFGGTTADAVSALSSLLRGERDPIERYGVSINQAAVDAELARQGLDGLTGEAAKNAQLQATLALLTQQTADAQGQFAREAGTAAGAQQIANAEYENARAALGEQLLPVVSTITQHLTEFAQWVQENTTLVTIITATIGGLAAGILVLNGIVKTVRILTQAWTIAQRALNLVMRLNPIGLVVTAIAALVAGIIYAYNNSETFRNIVNKLWSAIKTGARWVMNTFVDIARSVMRTGSAVKDGLGAAWDWVADKWDYFYDRIVGGINWVKSLVSDATGLIRNMFSFSMPGWMSTIGGWIGLSAEDDESADTFARASSTEQQLVAPARFAPSAPLAAAAAGGSSQPIQITVHGALDPDSVARQLEGILGRMLRRRGTRSIGQAVFTS